MRTSIIGFVTVIVVAMGWGGRAASAGPAESLPSQVVGVVSSGPQLTLRIKEGDVGRTLNIGDVYQDGWRLQGLSNQVATFGKDGQQVRVGLNPTGALPSAPTAPKSALGLVQWRDERVVDQPQPGLNLQQTKTLEALQARIGQILEILAAKAIANGKTITPEQVPSEAQMSRQDILGALGPDGVVFDDLIQKRYSAALAGYQAIGPVSVTLPFGSDLPTAAAKAGIDGALYTRHINFFGGAAASVTLTAVPPPPLMGDYADVTTLGASDPPFSLVPSPFRVLKVSPSGAISLSSPDPP